MPRRPTRSAPTVIVPGWQGSGPGHWQRWLGDQLREAQRVVVDPDLGDLDAPVLEVWLAGLREAVAGLPDGGYDVVAHSLGAVTWLHHAAAENGAPRPARVLLVSPPSPTLDIAELAAFFPPPLATDAVRQAAEGTALVGGDDDPYCPEGVAVGYGAPLKMAATLVPGGGHLNVESGYGEWPAVLGWCGRDNLAFY